VIVASELLYCQVHEKEMIGCVVRIVMSGTTKYALVRKAGASLLVVDATDWNCITKRSELYVRRYIFDQM
jgi:hypothetical protein